MSESKNILQKSVSKLEMEESDRTFQTKCEETLKDIVVRAGNQDSHQKFILIIISGLGMFYSMVLFVLPYVFLKPAYLCETASGVFEKCSEELACRGQFKYKLSPGCDLCWFWRFAYTLWELDFS